MLLQWLLRMLLLYVRLLRVLLLRARSRGGVRHAMRPCRPIQRLRSGSSMRREQAVIDTAAAGKAPPSPAQHSAGRRPPNARTTHSHTCDLARFMPPGAPGTLAGCAGGCCTTMRCWG